MSFIGQLTYWTARVVGYLRDNWERGFYWQWRRDNRRASKWERLP